MRCVCLENYYLAWRCVLTLQPALISGHDPQEVGHLHHFIFHVLQEMHCANFLTSHLVKNLRAGGIALWPQATIDYMLGADGDGRGVGALVATDAGVALQALFPAVQGCRQGCAFDPNICPGAAEEGHRTTEGQTQTRLHAQRHKGKKSVLVETYFELMSSCARQDGANAAL